MGDVTALFTSDWADGVFPAERADAFFDALYGDCEDGAYDITLRFVEQKGDTLRFNFELHQRPGACLACNLTYGLPQVFSRHPLINVKGVVEAVAQALKVDIETLSWELARTEECSAKLHLVPLVITLS